MKTTPKIIKATPKVVFGSINPIAYDQLRIFNRKSAFRQTLDDITRLTWKDKNRPVHFAKSDAWENALLALIFNNTNVGLIGDATGLRGSTTAGAFWFALHSIGAGGDPGVLGDQTTNEMTNANTSSGYGGYARATSPGGVPRTSSGFTITGSSSVASQAVLASPVSFPAGTSGSGIAAFCSIGTALSGAGFRLYSGAINPNIQCGNLITPTLTTATVVTEV